MRYKKPRKQKKMSSEVSLYNSIGKELARKADESIWSDSAELKPGDKVAWTDGEVVTVAETGPTRTHKQDQVNERLAKGLGKELSDSHARGLIKAVTPDFTAQNEGSIFLLWPHTAAAEEWAKEHLPADCPLFGRSYAIEHRFIADIVEGIQADGLVVE